MSDAFKCLHYQADPQLNPGDRLGFDYVGRPYEVVDVEQLPDERWRVHLQLAALQTREALR